MMIPLFLLLNLISTLTRLPISESSSVHPTDVVLVGSVLCDTTTNCLPQYHGHPQPSQFISGATVSIHCEDSSSGASGLDKKARTDSRGRFKFRLPDDVAKVVLKRGDSGVCSVKLVGSGDPKCSIPSLGSSSIFHRLKSTRHGHSSRFSSGVLSFKPTSSLCGGKRMTNFFFPPVPGVTPPPLTPPIPGLTPPPLIPPIPGFTPPPPLIPLPPIPGLTPPPSPLIPLPPIPGFTPPPPPPLIHLPPIPGFTPPPSPPPSFPIPFPPVSPFPPIPGFTHPPPPPPPPPVFPFPPLPFLPPPSPPGGPPASIAG
ncbi:hypothetical protein MLD38_001272 [Melastoma candidum]|uniref:Uncharacterized protein n=1 Tax=Melastoma candidum TaxID=119954 RepID=A0ACB9SG23_9MYRT|nr:hypothetical protein MLD38_001272 [Melastoma candidum]